MNERISQVIDSIAALPPDWHGCGSVSPATLKRIAELSEEIGPIERTVETGSGKTTLLFSNLSPNHLVFSYNHAGSVSKVKESPICRAESVTWVEGFTQRTIPSYSFNEPFQIVLIDGPHGYPFPDLEYYYLYPHIAKCGLFLLDDTQIPTIGRMFDILKADEMFRLIDVVDRTAFFRRTGAPLINPFGDDWWLQGHNEPYFREMNGEAPGQPKMLRRAVKTVGRFVPRPIKRMVKDGLKTALRDE